MESQKPATIPPLPPSPTFESFDELYEYLQRFCRENGAALVKSSSGGKRMINGKMISTHVILVCDRGRRRPSQATGLRSCSTTKNDCRFKVTAKTSKKVKGMWSYVVGDDTHNHPPSSHPSAHAVHRKRTTQQKRLIKVLSQQRELSAQSVHSIVRDVSSTEESFFTKKDIYNDRRILKNQNLENSSETAA